MVFGYFVGSVENPKEPKFNDRFLRPKRFYLTNQFVYASSFTNNKVLRVTCTTKAKIDETKCCRVRLPMHTFWKRSPEAEFDLIAIAASKDVTLKSWPLLLEKTPRMRFRKATTKTGGRMEVTQKFCFEPSAYGRFKIRFQIMAKCDVLSFKACQELGTRKVDRFGFGDKENIVAPRDFTVPPPLSIIVPQFDLHDIKIVPEGSGQGDVIGVTNNQPFTLRIFMMG